MDSIPITVAQGLAVTSEGVLELLFEADPWDSVISFEPGVPVSIEGTLKLDFAFDVELASQVGRTLLELIGDTPPTTLEGTF